MTNTPLRVAVIGAGLGGLCLAHGLCKHGIAVQVYERDASLDARDQGYRLRIDQQGRAALAACLPDALFARFVQTCAVPAPTLNLLDARLERASDHGVDGWQAGASDADADLRADRQRMRAVLLTGLAERVHFGKALTRYEAVDDRAVIARFDDGSAVEADVLIGADGIHSRLRAQRFPDMAPIDTGTVCCYGKTWLTAVHRDAIAAQLQTGTSVIFQPGWAAIIDAMVFRPEHGAGQTIGQVDDYVYWALIGQRGALGIAGADDLGWTEAALRGWLSERVGAWPEPIRALFERTAPQAATLLPVRRSPLPAAWPASRISALGDALHAMSPAGGKGANCALYDAQALTEALRQVRGPAMAVAAIAAYETQVREHSFAAARASRDAERQLFSLPDD
ncbi:FAD-dependent oxidoreductase [Rugamonas apoptosis]|uniref:FAD-dependent monooxygenase n=1 Tax=Rugamonas apoptosis TaxID=2758570 RepID=A0A7W2FER5_9BURK|nr:NAD(P)/FAD-dependent oxidoreductase [Rugamonas apoptosis]MBA5690340.1 FAD-dependent monooxygenase [Rugamonas apoptosis]